MIGGKTVLAIIPARGGSKGVKKKNIRDVGGRPLLAWTIEQAKNSKYIDRVILTSEDPEIIEVAKRLGCEVPFVRPAELSRDETPGMDPILHAIEILPAHDFTVELQVTSPLRASADIDACLERLAAGPAPAIVSVVRADKSPYWMVEVDSRGLMKPILKTEAARRQDLPAAFAYNGAVYAARTPWLKSKRSFISEETIAYEMPLERSIDIDSEFDLFLADAVLRAK